ncbi:hypothetical protein JTB14_001515 [Gonioctena quinquepunctata]|nr:hypothetical protein JTB14_001515 [Gonioctena quinquepunctata]
MEQEGGLDYYKSLVSDGEVIEALIKESKAREGELEKTRVRPNLNFLQRTVSNMLSSNKRITNKQEAIIAKEREKNISSRPRKVPVRKKLHLQLIQEILHNEINLVKSRDEREKSSSRLSGENLTKVKSYEKRKNKSPFQVMKEILENQVKFVKDSGQIESTNVKRTISPNNNISDESSTSRIGIRETDHKDTKFKQRKKKKRRSSNSSNASVISVSDSNSNSSVCSTGSDVIMISDSDSGSSSWHYKKS